VGTKLVRKKLVGDLQQGKRKKEKLMQKKLVGDLQGGKAKRAELLESTPRHPLL
jgi:hypothetical protein